VKTIGEIMGTSRTIRKGGELEDSTGSSDAVRAKLLDAEIARIDEFLAELGRFLAANAGRDPAAMPPDEIEALRGSHALVDRLVAIRGARHEERVLVGAAAEPQTLEKRQVRDRAADELASAQAEFDSAVRSGRRLALREEQGIRQRLVRAEMIFQAANF
jgi:hypothetical protein